MRKGAALPTMLLVIAMTSALAVGGAFAARELATNQRAVQRGAELEPEAESAIARAVAGWDSSARAAQPVGATSQPLTSTLPGMRVDVWITRLDNDLYWIVGQARGLTRPRLFRRLGLAVRLRNGTPAPVPERAWAELP